jgi:hypothetical protein
MLTLADVPFPKTTNEDQRGRCEGVREAFAQAERQLLPCCPDGVGRNSAVAALCAGLSGAYFAIVGSSP